MATAKKTAPKKKTNGKGGARDGAGASQLIPNKVRKTIDIPSEVAEIITSNKKGNSDISSYARKAIYNQLVSDGHLSKKRAAELLNWKKKAA